jgi:acyl-coenzyme A thioesterase PaaI-like protein
MDISEQRPNPHPALAGREVSMGELADTVRRLIELTVTCDVPDDVAGSVGAELRAAADRLAPFRSDPPHPRYAIPTTNTEGALVSMQEAMPYDVVLGRYNPLALPLTMSVEPGLAVATGTFTAAYEGAPGWVHGAVIAAAFDLVLTGANRLESSGGPTVWLTMRYRRPTILDEECRFEAWVEGTKGDRIISQGRLVQGDKVKVEAEGEFVMRSPEQLGRPGGRAGTGS